MSLGTTAEVRRYKRVLSTHSSACVLPRPRLVDFSQESFGTQDSPGLLFVIFSKIELKAIPQRLDAKVDLAMMENAWRLRLPLSHMTYVARRLTTSRYGRQAQDFRRTKPRSSVNGSPSESGTTCIVSTSLQLNVNIRA